MGDTNNQEINISRIRNALGNPDGCKIESNETLNIYIIKPEDAQEEVHISVINNVMHNNKLIHLFRAFSLSFQKCVFENEILLGGEICTYLHFGKCIFRKNMRISMYTNIKDFVSFSESTFEQHAFFVGAIFNKKIDFGGTIFRGYADFQHTTFNNNVNFSRSTFEQKAIFSQTTFRGETDFGNVSFKMKAIFSGSNFKEKVQFKETTFDNYAHFDNVQFGDEIKSTKEKTDYNVNFSIAKFNGKVDFSKANFQYKTYFQSTIFSDYANFDEVKFVDEVSFSHTHFKGGACLTSSSFRQNACFVAVTFHDNANFDHAKFQVGEDCEAKGIADFSGVHFIERAELRSIFGHDASFHRVIFGHNGYFDGAEFKQKVDFSQSEFYKNAYFYKTKFKSLPKENIQEKDIPNFLQTIFNGSINLTDTPLFMLDFKDLKSIIKDSHKANEFRDTFKNIKNALIKDNNLLDASRFHKMELYAKEIELEYKKKEEPQNSGIRDIVDRIQLMFYRLTSDHHTDLLLILNNVIFLIAWFGFMNGALNFLFNQDYFDLSIEKIIMALGAFVACFIFAIITLCFMFGYFKIFFVAYARKRLYCKIRKLWKQFNLRQLFNKYKNKNGIFCIAYIITAIILVVKPALLVPIFGQMIDTKSSIGFAFASLNIIYAIFMFLLIFSLQKTARKNTIVPN